MLVLQAVPGMEAPPPEEEEGAPAGVSRLASEHHHRCGQAFIEGSISTEREGIHLLVESPGLWGSPTWPCWS